MHWKRQSQQLPGQAAETKHGGVIEHFKPKWTVPVVRKGIIGAEIIELAYVEELREYQIMIELYHAAILGERLRWFKKSA